MLRLKEATKFEGMGSKCSQKSQRHAGFPLVGVTEEHQVTEPWGLCSGLRSDPHRAASVSVGLY